MTYKNSLVVEVKYNGKILRVRDDTVTLPFGSEYSLLLKNLNTKRACVKISIDGQDVLDSTSLVLSPNETTELQGFLRNNIATNKFKFIQKTKEIQEHRGDNLDDGLIRVEFAFEEPVIQRNIIKDYDWPHRRDIIWEHHHHHYYSPFRYDYYNNPSIYYCSNLGANTGDSVKATSENVSYNANLVSNQVQNLPVENFAPNQDEGITVKGSEINQQFNYTSIGTLSQAEVIIIKLRGENIKGEPVQTPITVSTKLTCKTCGRTSSSSSKFCSNCGTFLE
jgi:hypothetical protein